MKPGTLVGCGILEKEVRALIAQHDWPVTCHFSCSALHVDFNRLRHALERNLRRTRGKNPQVFYGTCHPQMAAILRAYGVARTAGQNCIEILLGKERFQRELGQGAFFLLEDWALHWRKVVPLAMGDDPAFWREIMQGQHRYVLGVRTPCSQDFSAQAEEFAVTVGLPLRWLDVGLEHLESVLLDLLESGGNVRHV